MPRCQFMEHTGDVHQRPPLVVAFGPHIALGPAGNWCSVFMHGREPSAILVIDLVLLNESPLLKECLPVLRCFFAVFLVHQKEDVEPFRLGPPDLITPGCCAIYGTIIEESAMLFVPSIFQCVVHQHSSYYPGSLIIGLSQGGCGFC